MALNLVTAPLELPLTLAEAREHLQPSHTQQDSVILSLIEAARVHAEDITKRRFITQTWDYILDEFPTHYTFLTAQPYYHIEIPYAPLQSITSVTYLDGAGAPQVIPSANYRVDTASNPGRVTPVSDAAWPMSTTLQFNAVTIRFVCGYGMPEAVPYPIKQAMLLMIGHWYEHREEVSDVELYQVPMAAAALLSPYRLWSV